MYALFKDGKQISKWHSTRLTVVIEAMDHKCLMNSPADFVNDQTINLYLANGYEIKEN